MTINLNHIEDPVVDLIELARAAQTITETREQQIAIHNIAVHLNTILTIIRNIVNPSWNSTKEGEELEGRRLEARAQRKAQRDAAKEQASND